MRSLGVRRGRSQFSPAGVQVVAVVVVVPIVVVVRAAVAVVVVLVVRRGALVTRATKKQDFVMMKVCEKWVRE